MAQLDVEKKKDGGNKWWIWLLVALAAIVIIWMVFENNGDDDMEDMNDDPITETIPLLNENIQLSNKSLVSISKNLYEV